MQAPVFLDTNASFADQVFCLCTQQVLLEYWRGAGCTTDFPVNEGPDGWWRNHELVIVENDMQLWYEYATEGEPTYQAACFGNKGDLLMQWYVNILKY